MLSFKRIIILSSVSRLIANFSGFNFGNHFIAANESTSVPEPKTGDGTVVDGGNVTYDVVSELPVSTDGTKDQVVKTETVITTQKPDQTEPVVKDEPVKTETVVTTHETVTPKTEPVVKEEPVKTETVDSKHETVAPETEVKDEPVNTETVTTEEKVVKKVAPVTGSDGSLSDETTKTRVVYKNKFVYLPKMLIKKVLRPFGKDFVSTDVVGKRTQTTHEEDSDAKKSKVPTLPEVETAGSDKVESVKSDDITESNDGKFKNLPTEIEEKLLTQALKMGSLGTPEKPDVKSDSDVLVSDESTYSEIPELNYDNLESISTDSQGSIYEPIYENLGSVSTGSQEHIYEPIYENLGTVSTPAQENFYEPIGDNLDTVSTSNEEPIYSEIPEPIYENIGPSPTGNKDEFPHRKLYEVPLQPKRSDGAKTSAREVFNSATRRVHGAAHKTAKEAGKFGHKIKHASKDIKSHVSGGMVKAKDFIGKAAHETAKGGARLGEKVRKVSKKHYKKSKISAETTADGLTKDISKATEKTVTEVGSLGDEIKDKTKVTYKDVKTRTRVTMGDASRRIHGAAHKTAKEAGKFGQKIKEQSGVFASGAKQAASLTKNRLQGAAHKVSKEAGKLGDNIKTSGSKTKGSVTKYFKNKFGKVVPEVEVTRL